VTVAFTIDRRWAGFYLRCRREMGRICFGFFAIDYFAESVDVMLEGILR
jgi:hypothetical protein